MNIQMILSALPTQLSGKPQSGAGEGANAGLGHFALALNQAAQAGGAKLSLPLNAASVEGLPPPTMAAQQALLQSLNAHATQQLDGEAELAQPDTQLGEIMARLALIEGTIGENPSPEHQESVIGDLQSLSGQELALPDDGMTAELAEQPQAAALVAAAAAETQRPSGAIPAMNAAGESAVRPDMPAVPSSSPSGNPLTSQMAASAAAAAQKADGDAGAPARPADFTSAFTKATAQQATANQAGGNELRAVAAETARGGFVPDAASMSQAQPSGTTAGQANPTAQPALPSQASLAAPVQSPAWPGQLGQQLVQFARQGGEQQVEMRLNPAELGPLSVTLKMTEQGAQAQFMSAHAQVRQVLEQAIPQLREALAEQGITLGDTSVGEQRRQDAQAFAGNEGQRGKGGMPQAEGEAILAAGNDATLGTSAPLTLDGRVNLYA